MNFIQIIIFSFQHIDWNLIKIIQQQQFCLHKEFIAIGNCVRKICPVRDISNHKVYMALSVWNTLRNFYSYYFRLSFAYQRRFPNTLISKAKSFSSLTLTSAFSQEINITLVPYATLKNFQTPVNIWKLIYPYLICLPICIKRHYMFCLLLVAFSNYFLICLSRTGQHWNFSCPVRNKIWKSLKIHKKILFPPNFLHWLDNLD